MENLLYIIALYFALGAFAGFTSGLLGIGGGAVIVPGLAYIFALQGFPQAYLMHYAIGTSLAIIVIATLRGLFAYHRTDMVFWPIFKRMLAGLIIGAILGSIVGHFMHSHALEIIFGVFVLVIAAKMLLYQPKSGETRIPGKVGLGAFGLFTGVQSGLLGLGGGTFTIPFLQHFGVDKHTTQMNALACSLVTAVFGAITMMITGNQMGVHPWGAIGYIYWPAWFATAAGTLLTVPLGSRLAYHAPVLLLRRLFVIFLLSVAIHLFWSALH